VPDYANGLVKLVVFFGVINHAPISVAREAKEAMPPQIFRKYTHFVL